MREIIIRAALNGWIVQVGCQAVVYLDRELMFSDIKEYMDNPSKKEENFLKTATNRHLCDQGIQGRPQVINA